MTSRTPDQGDFRGYLLDESDEAEKEALERAYLSQGDILDSFIAAEQELIEDYLDDRLDPERRGRFENRYLASPVHRRRLEIARALGSYALPRARRRSALILAATAAGLLIALLGTLWIRLPGDDRFATLTLPAVIVRSEGTTPTAWIDPSISELRLRLENAGWQARPSYVVMLQTPEGDVVWRGAGLPASADGSGGAPPQAEVAVPTDAIAAGDYFVVLSTAEPREQELHRYFFRVIRREAR